MYNSLPTWTVSQYIHLIRRGLTTLFSVLFILKNIWKRFLNEFIFLWSYLFIHTYIQTYNSYDYNVAFINQRSLSKQKITPQKKQNMWSTIAFPQYIRTVHQLYMVQYGYISYIPVYDYRVIILISKLTYVSYVQYMYMYICMMDCKAVCKASSGEPYFPPKSMIKQSW